MASTSPKRVRFDASAAIPSNSATTPMASARESLKSSVESLHPEIATILSRLATELLVIYHKLATKQNKVTQFETEESYIPISARCKFTLNCSKLVEQDPEYIRLAGETKTLVDDFQKALRSKIFETTKLEVNHLLKEAQQVFVKNLRMAVKSLVLVERDFTSSQVDKIVTTLVALYGDKLLVHLDLSQEEFSSLYKSLHQITTLPGPFITAFPIEQTGNATRPASTLPPQSVLTFFPKLWRIVESSFISPFSMYRDIVTRNATSLELRKLNEEFFKEESTQEAAMEVDDEPPQDPKILKDLIKTDVDKATKKLTAEVQKLKIAIAKNSPRDQAGASRKKKSGNQNQAVGANSATADGKRKNQKSPKSKKKPKKSPSSNKRNSNSTGN